MSIIFIVSSDDGSYGGAGRDILAAFDDALQAQKYAKAMLDLDGSVLEVARLDTADSADFLDARCVDAYVTRRRPNGQVVDHKRVKRVFYGTCSREFLFSGKSAWCYTDESQEVAREMAADA